MCGIIGYIGPSRSSRSSSTACGGSSTAATTRRASPSSATARSTAPQRRQAVEPRERHRSRPAGRRLRRRPHALGHARPADRGERPPAPRLHRPHRRRPQRHHRELPRAEARAAVPGPQVRHRDRHRDRRAPGRAARCKATTALERVERLDGATRRALRACAGCSRWCSSRPTTRTRSSPSATARRSSSASATASSSSRPTSPPSSRHTRDVVFLGDEEMAVITQGRRRVHRLRGHAARPPDAARALGPDHGGEGRLQALHAQGDLRAAAGGARHDPRPRVARHRAGLPRGDDALARPISRRSKASRSSRAARRGTPGWSASS